MVAITVHTDNVIEMWRSSVVGPFWKITQPDFNTVIFQSDFSDSVCVCVCVLYVVLSVMIIGQISRLCLKY